MTAHDIILPERGKCFSYFTDWRCAEAYVNVKLINSFGPHAHPTTEKCESSALFGSKLLIRRAHKNYVLTNSAEVERYAMVSHKKIRRASDGLFHLVVVDLIRDNAINEWNKLFFDAEGFDAVVCRFLENDKSELYRARFLRAEAPFKLMNLIEILDNNISDWYYKYFKCLKLMKCPEACMNALELTGLSDRDYALRLYRDSEYCGSFHSKDVFNTFLYPRIEYYRYANLRAQTIHEYSKESWVRRSKDIGSVVRKQNKLCGRLGQVLRDPALAC